MTTRESEILKGIEEILNDEGNSTLESQAINFLRFVYNNPQSQTAADLFRWSEGGDIVSSDSDLKAIVKALLAKSFKPEDWYADEDAQKA